MSTLISRSDNLDADVRGPPPLAAVRHLRARKPDANGRACRRGEASHHEVSRKLDARRGDSARAVSENRIRIMDGAEFHPDRRT